MDVTLSNTLSWDPIIGAEFQVRVLNVTGAPIGSIVENGTVNSIGIVALLSGLPGNTYKFQVRSILPGGGLPSAWSAEIVVTLVGFPVPTGLVIT